jgi:H+/Cl- antiporter ClcA
VAAIEPGNGLRRGWRRSPFLLKLLRWSRLSVLDVAIWRQRLVFWVGALVVGLVAVAFALACNYAEDLFYQEVFQRTGWNLLVTPLGMAAIAALVHRHFRGAERSGIPQVMVAIDSADAALRSRLLSLRFAIARLGFTLLSVLAGASVGRQGPTVFIGASIMHAFGRLGAHSGAEMPRALIIAGSAAGVAAAFNTPMAGIVFAIEAMSRSFEQRTSGLVITAVVIAGLTAVSFLGYLVHFETQQFVVQSRAGWTAALLCGIVGGLAGSLFCLALTRFPDYLPARARRAVADHPVAIAFGCGLALALLSLGAGYNLGGTGHQDIRLLLHDADVPAGYALLKSLATFLCFATGIPGGVFMPSLAIGAGIGKEIHVFFPEVVPAMLVSLGMASFFSGAVRTPITATVICLEMTGNHLMALPTLSAALIALGVSRLIVRDPLYVGLAKQVEQREVANGASP